MRFNLNIKRGRLALIAALTSLPVPFAHAGNVWDGGGATGNWSDAANWDANAYPASPTALTFGGTLQTSSNNNQFTAATTFNGITFSAGAGAFTLTGNSITLGGNVTNSSTNLQKINLDLVLSGTRTFTSTTGNIEVGAAISGSAGIIKAGNGTTLTLSASSNYTGSTTVNAGTLNLTGTLSNSSSIATGGSGAFNQSSTGFFTGSGNLNLNGSGTSTISGANTFTGSTTISNGTVIINSLADSGTSALANSGTIGVQSNGTLVYNTSGTNAGGTTRSVTLGNTGGGTSTIDSSSASSAAVLTLGRVTSAGTRNTGTTNLVLTGTNTGLNTITGASQVLSNGNGGNIVTVTKQGTGTWRLSGANTYGGSTTISQGTLILGNAKALGGGTTTLMSGSSGASVASGAVLDLSGQTINKTITLNGTGINGEGALINSSISAATISGGVLSALALTSGGSGYSSVPTVTLGGGATATASLGLTQASATLSGGSGYTNGAAFTFTGGGGAGAGGTLIVSLGQITGFTLTSSGAGYTGAPTGITVTGGSGVSVSGNATNFTVAGLTLTNVGSGITSAPAVSFSGSPASPASATASLSGVILGSTSAIGGTGPITIAGPISEGGSGFGLSKVGSNTVTLSASNTYTGATDITSGTILLTGSGSVNSTSEVSVDAGATFTNNSSVAFSKVLELAEGAVFNGSGTFTPSAIAIDGDLSGALFTTFSIGSASLVKDGSLDLTLTGITEGSYTLFSGGTISSGFDSLTVGGVPLTNLGSGNFAGLVGGVNYAFTNSTNQLLVSIPEPASASMLLLGMSAMLAGRRRRQV